MTDRNRTSAAQANARAFADNFAYEPTTHVERASAFALAGALVATFGCIAPFGRLRLPAVPAFVVLVGSVMVAALFLTSSTLYAQYRARRYAPLGLLSFAFGAWAVMQIVDVAAFPGVLGPRGAFGGSETAAWASLAGRLIFDGLVIGYVVAEWLERRGRALQGDDVIAAGRLVGAVVVACVAAVTMGQRFLPNLYVRDALSPFYFHVAQPALLLLPIAACVALVAVSGLRTRVSVWLSVTLLANVLAVCASGLLASQRFTAGWYLARVDLALGSLLFVVAMQVQLAGVLERAARASRRSQALFQIVSGATELARGAIETLLSEVRGELEFEWAFFARIEDGRATIQTSVGKTPYDGDSRVRLESTLLGAVTGRELFVLEDAWTSAGDESRTLWAAFMSVPVFVDGKLYGSAGFASRRRRRAPLNDADRDFMYMLGIVMGSSIERDVRAKQLAGLAYFDVLTGLPNRAHFMSRVREKIAHGERYGSRFAVHFLDLDRFKAINDGYGHATGDEVLRGFAERLRLCVRETDVVARLGGDEFVVLQHLERGFEEAPLLAARIADLSCAKLATRAGSLQIGVSVGTACYPRDGDDASELLAQADAAQYRVKRKRASLPQRPRAANPLPFEAAG